MSLLKGASGTELLFWCCAVAGTLFFSLRVGMMAFVGLGDDADADIDGDAGADADAAEGGHHHGSDAAFKLFSVHSVTGFVMMFGWAGLSAYKQFGLGAAISFMAAGGVGAATMYMTAYFFKVAVGLTTIKAPYTTKDLVGKDATVYLKIPAKGRGKVQLPHEGLTRELEAVSEDDEDIASFKVVRIVRAMDARTVSVRRKD